MTEVFFEPRQEGGQDEQVSVTAPMVAMTAMISATRAAAA